MVFGKTKIFLFLVLFILGSLGVILPKFHEIQYLNCKLLNTNYPNGVAASSEIISKYNFLIWGGILRTLINFFIPTTNI
jgi:hypothetical protein